MNTRRISIVLAVVIVIALAVIGISGLVKKNNQRKYEQQQIEFRESLDNNCVCVK